MSINPELIARWQKAYTAAWDKPAPLVTYNRGWYTIRFPEGMLSFAKRGAQLETMTKILEAQAR